jgi:CPA1 family monovalent cation:H+ antiporter
MHSSIEPTEMIALLGVAMITAIVLRRFALPYTVGLVVVGAILAVAHVGIGVALTREFIFNVILPPLLFEAAINLRWSDLRKDLGVILTLSTLGTIISAAFVAFSMNLFLSWPLSSALVFGALIAATDPVAVIAMFKDMGMHGRLRVLVESESLFNDAAAAILFSLAIVFATAGGAMAPLDLGLKLGSTVIGGIVAGTVSAGVALLLIGRTTDHLVEATLTTLAAYGAFFGAEQIGVSGILATVVAGLIMGNVGLLRSGSANAVSEKGREFILSFWDFAAFLANSTIFPLIGLSVGAMTLGWPAIGPLTLSIGVVLIGRALTVYPLSFLFGHTAQATTLQQQHVLWWGGLRGALALALALSLPAALPFREQIVVTTFVIAAFSIIVQGLTTPWLMRWLGLSGDHAATPSSAP